MENEEKIIICCECEIEMQENEDMCLVGPGPDYFCGDCYDKANGFELTE